MVIYIVGCWMFGLAWVGILSLLVPSELDWTAVVARLCFVAGIAVMLWFTAVIVAAGNSYAVLSPSRNGLWFYSLGSAIPVIVLAFLVTRPVLPHPVWTALATLPAAAVLAAAPAAFAPFGSQLHGLARFAHEHHSLVNAALAAATAIVLVAVTVPRRTAATS